VLGDGARDLWAHLEEDEYARELQLGTVSDRLQGSDPPSEEQIDKWLKVAVPRSHLGRLLLVVDDQ
jgi:hypothetical protein